MPPITQITINVYVEGPNTKHDDVYGAEIPQKIVHHAKHVVSQAKEVVNEPTSGNQHACRVRNGA